MPVHQGGAVAIPVAKHRRPEKIRTRNPAGGNWRRVQRDAGKQGGAI